MAPALKEYSHLEDWDSADEALGSETSKKIGNNTSLVRLHDGDIAVTLHGNRIVRYLKGRGVMISSAGWKTDTTKDRLNRYTDSKTSIVQEDYTWYVKRGKKKVRFKDGMRLP